MVCHATLCPPDEAPAQLRKSVAQRARTYDVLPQMQMRTAGKVQMSTLPNAQVVSACDVFSTPHG